MRTAETTLVIVLFLTAILVVNYATAWRPVPQISAGISCNSNVVEN